MRWPPAYIFTRCSGGFFRRDGVLRGLAHTCRARHLGALRAAAISLKAIEPLQLVLGLSIPALIIAHLAGVRLGQALFGHEKFYPQVLYAYWVVWPTRMWLMFVVLIVAWVHGCIGLYFWLRMKAFFKSAAPFLLATAVLIPTLAMLGLYQGGRSVVETATAGMASGKSLAAQVGTAAEQSRARQRSRLFPDRLSRPARIVLLARARVRASASAGRHDQLSYGNGRTVRVPKGLSVLEASLRNNVPHASVCGGRARCSTCRIRVIGDCSRCRSRPSARRSCSTASGRRRSAIRLACQLRPRPICPSSRSFCRRPRRHHAQLEPHRIGEERYLVSMFVDMRGSTKLAEKRCRSIPSSSSTGSSARCRRR
jgi:adenylate cyclase